MDMKRFNERMGKKHRKGGMIKKIAGRAYFDTGGSTTLTGPTGSIGPANTVNNNGLTGTIGSELGLNNQFQAGAANIGSGTNTAQLQGAYTGAQSGLTQQQNLANQTQPGVAQGLGTQGALTGQLEGVANGTGPNAAQAALNQNTATNVANTAALMAGQRGSSANAGLIARQAGQQGAATQQAAVGQGATLQAQQAIAAQQQLAGLSAQQVGQGAQAVQGVNQTQQNEQNILQGANTAYNNAAVGMQSNVNNVNAGVAGANQQQAGNVVNGIGGLIGSGVSAIGGLIGLAKGGEVSHHCAGAHCTDRAHYAHMMAGGGEMLSVPPESPVTEGVGPWLNSNPDTSGPDVQNAPVPSPNLSSPFSKWQIPGSSGVSNSTPGEVATAGNNYATEANNWGANGTAASANNFGAAPLAMPQSGLGFSGAAPTLGVATDLGTAALAHGGQIAREHPGAHFERYFSGGGEVSAMVSSDERYLNPEEVRKVVHEGADPLKLGKVFKGKAKVKGDSLKNDDIPATLEEGGVVVPRHITMMKGPHKSDKAALFVNRAMHMKSPKGGK